MFAWRVVGSVNAAGVLNSANNRVDVEFRRIVFSLDELFGRPVRLRKVLKTARTTGLFKASDKDYDPHRRMVNAVFGPEGTAK